MAPIKAAVKKGFEFLVDSREKQKIKAMVKRMGIKHSVTALNADFVLRRWDKPVEDIVGIERKAIPDLIQSVHTRRIFKQIKQLKMTHKYCYLMISGSIKDHIAKMRHSIKLKINPAVTMGTLASFAVRERINVMWFPDDSTLIEMAFRICVKVSEGKFGQERSMEPKYEMYDPISMLNSHIPRVSRKVAKALLSHFGNVANLGQANIKQISVVPGVGTDTASLVYNILHTGVK